MVILWYPYCAHGVYRVEQYEQCYSYPPEATVGVIGLNDAHPMASVVSLVGTVGIMLFVRALYYNMKHVSYKRNLT